MQSEVCVKNTLRVLAFKKDVSLSEVSRHTGISRTTLSAIYRNRSRYISYDVLGKLCAFFDCSVGEFLVFEKSNDKSPAA